MQEWYVGKQANCYQQWLLSYRLLLRTINSCSEWSAVQTIRYSKPLLDKRNDRYIYLGINASTRAEANQIAADIFDAANDRYQVGFGPLYPAEPLTKIEGKGNFLEPTEFPTDGRIPVESFIDEEDYVGAFSYYDSASQPAPQSTVDSAPFDRFLKWLSAAGEGRWESFLRVAKILGVVIDTGNARRLYRRLVLLGHLDSSPDGHSWSIAPPVIVQSATDPRTGFWCGCRSEPLLRMLPESWDILDTVPQPDGFGPAKRPIVVPSESAAQWLPASTDPPTWRTPSWGGPVAERLAALLPHIDEWAKMLQPIVNLTPPDAAELWDLGAAEFRKSLDFRIDSKGRCHGTTGLYRLTYGEAPKAYQLTVFLDAEAKPTPRVFRGEWYGLRFLARHRSNKKPKAEWSADQGGMLTIMKRLRWPLLHERALVLASGLLPASSSDGRYLYYQGVPLALAKTIADHLDVHIETQHE